MTGNRFRAAVSDVCCCCCQTNASLNKLARASAPNPPLLHRVWSLHPVPQEGQNKNPGCLAERLLRMVPWEQAPRTCHCLSAPATVPSDHRWQFQPEIGATCKTPEDRLHLSLDLSRKQQGPHQHFLRGCCTVQLALNHPEWLSREYRSCYQRQAVAGRGSGLQQRWDVKLHLGSSPQSPPQCSHSRPPTPRVVKQRGAPPPPPLGKRHQLIQVTI